MRWQLIFRVYVKILGVLIGLVGLIAVLRYRDLQRWLREKRERRAEK